ncbi:MAG: HYR domain-containing protein, partial [Chloroflexi bacterium]
GGNIRQVFFFRTDRGLAFVERPGATSTTPNAVVNAGGPQLLYSPGRIDPTNSAFNSSRKPLAAEFTYNGHHFFVVANHFNSKGGDDPLWGRHQPPVLASELQRQQQANIVKAFVQQILGFDANAEVVVLGDLNDFEWSNPLMALKSAPGPLNDLIETLPANERYTYVFEGNSQTLDHILVSDRLLALGARTDVVHVNAEFWDQASDHDPQVAMLPLRDTVPPTFTSVPATQTYFTGPAATTCTVLVTDDMLGLPTATDNASGVSINRSGVPAGNLFPCGVTIVSYVASDDAGNTATATQRITVIDNTPPVISAPPSVVVRTSDQIGQCTASVATNATATDNSGSAREPGTRRPGIRRHGD